MGNILLKRCAGSLRLPSLLLCVVLTFPSRNFCLLSVFDLGFLLLLCCRFTASFATWLKSWSTLRMSSLRACSRELPGCLMTSTKDLDMVLMMHSNMQSRKDFFYASRGLFQIAETYFLKSVCHHILLGCIIGFLSQSEYGEYTGQVNLVNFGISLIEEEPLVFICLS